VTSFWWGKEHVVSVCSPQAFKDTVKLTDRPGEGERKWRKGREKEEESSASLLFTGDLWPS